MNRRTPTLALGLLLAAAGASAGDRDDDRKSPFIGVFYPAVVGVGPDATRCPNPAQPILLSFLGTAQTNLGQAQIEQSHCEGGNLKFTRGVQKITFADGSQLFGTYEGELLVTPTTASDGQLIIRGRTRQTGGTGALAGARGDGISAGSVSTSTGAAVITVIGTL